MPLVSNHPFGRSVDPIAIAHRGGGREFPENSLTAFRAVYDMGYRHIETDVRATSDGSVMVFHDAKLSRVTDGVGKISALPYSEVAKARVSGRDQILTLPEMLEEFPDTNFNIDVKDDVTVEPFIEAMKLTQAFDRVCVGAFSTKRLRQIRKGLGEKLVTSLGPSEISILVSASQARRFSNNLTKRLPEQAVAAQVPVRAGKIPIVTKSFVDTAHRVGLAVHVWTIDDPIEMNRLFDLGVDGIMTDRPSYLSEVLESRRQPQSV